MTFSDKVKKLRKTLGVTQMRLAAMLKTSQSAIACWETGASGCRPSALDVLEKFCNKKGIKINWRK